MNFLAHLYLSGDNEEVLVGNFIGDFVKGSQMDHYPDQIQKGIRMHRSIDHFTDTHEVVLKSKVRLREKFRHYAPVIVDVYYDHFLARDWSLFSDVPLLEYTEHFYTMMDRYYDIIPKGVIHMLSYMSRDNWLYNYQFIEGIDRALTGMSRRTKFVSKMEEASQALQDHYEKFEEEFHQFFPDLQAHVAKFEV
ncbi:MAG: ACP phosphodiesterase [Ekhidna sp.]|uniref:acyl carrier protein phosphodiesterase n=1 Tax=Ekhidna sp. TaxID=2608089 RepID=UPI0032F024DB